MFDGVPAMLAALDGAGIRWGIVTNKIERYARPVVASLGLEPATLVCGDSTAHAKPHPAPLLEAARRVEVDPARCIYVGDDLRDIEAGRAAGMGTVAAAWGYLGSGAAVRDWAATAVIESPSELMACFRARA